MEMDLGLAQAQAGEERRKGRGSKSRPCSRLGRSLRKLQAMGCVRALLWTFLYDLFEAAESSIRCEQ